MTTREETQDFLIKLHSCILGDFHSEIDATQRGFGFVLSYLEQADGEVYER